MTSMGASRTRRVCERVGCGKDDSEYDAASMMASLMAWLVQLSE